MTTVDAITISVGKNCQFEEAELVLLSELYNQAQELLDKNPTLKHSYYENRRNKKEFFLAIQFEGPNLDPAVLEFRKLKQQMIEIYSGPIFFAKLNGDTLINAPEWEENRRKYKCWAMRVAGRDADIPGGFSGSFLSGGLNPHCDYHWDVDRENVYNIYQFAGDPIGGPKSRTWAVLLPQEDGGCVRFKLLPSYADCKRFAKASVKKKGRSK